MFAYSIDVVTSPPALDRRLFPTADRVIYRQLEILVFRAQRIGANAAAAAAPKHTGALKRSILASVALRPSMAGTGIAAARIGSNLPYAGAQEDASKHTAAGTWTPPSQPLINWVQNELSVESPREGAFLGWWIANQVIRNVGIKPKHFMVKGEAAILMWLPREQGRFKWAVKNELGLL